MIFLHAILLWFLPLALAPLILHLITLFRARSVELATYRFLFDSFTRQRRRLRFQEALLTFLRTLFLLGLVLLVCRPIARHWQGLFRSGAGRDRLVLVDASASMNRRTAGLTAFQRARAAAAVLARTAPAGERVTLLRIGARPDEVVRQAAAGDDELRRRIETLETGDSRANWLAAFAALDSAGLLANRPTIEILTDAQASDWREARERGLADLLPEGTRVIVVRVGDPGAGANVGVVGDPPAETLAVAGLPVLLQARVYNPGREPADVTVRLIVNDQEAGRSTLSLKPGGEATAALPYVPAEAGALRGRFEVGMDDFPDDNAYLFALSVAPRVPVLLVNGRQSRDPLEDAGTYLRAALKARAETAPGAAELLPSRAFLQALDVEEVPVWGMSDDRLARASVVILANAGGLNFAQQVALQKYVAAGGGLLVFPGDLASAFDYNHFLFSVGGSAQARVTPVELDLPQGDPGRARAFERLTAIDTRHPALRVFADPQANYLVGASFYRRFPLRLRAGAADGRVLARFALSDAPALVESRYGDGTMIVAAFPADNRWSNLPLKPEWVPFVLRLVSHVQRASEFRAPRLAAPGAMDEVSVPLAWAPVTGDVTDPGGRATPLAFQRAERRYVAPLDAVRAKGFYRVEAAGGDSQQPRHAAAVFAVNVPREESDPVALTDAGLRALFPKALLTIVEADAAAEQSHGRVGDEREVWRPLIFLLIAVMLVEFAVSTLRSGDDGGWRARARRAWAAWRGGMAGPEASA